MSPPSCPDCGGSTWKLVDGDRAQRVERCACFGATARDGAATLERMRVPVRFRDCAFDTRSGGKPFDLLSEALVNAARAAEQWADSFPKVESGLLLTGPPGVGKTHLAAAALRRIVLERGLPARPLFCDFRTLLRSIRASYNPESPESESELLRPVLTAEPLVLDDLGGESPTLWVFDTLFYILNQRYNDRRLTIITTNYSDRLRGSPAAPGGGPGRPRGAEEFSLAERVTARLRSRLYEMCRDVPIEAEDYRLKILQTNYRG